MTAATFASTSFCATVVPVFGIGLVVLAHHLEGDGLAVDRELLVVGVLHREGDAVLVILAEVGDGARERAGVGDGDGDAGGGGGFRCGLRLFLLAAGRNAERERDGEGKLRGTVHRLVS